MNFKVRSIRNKKDNNYHIPFLKVFLIAILVSFCIFTAFSFYVLAQVKNIVDTRYIQDDNTISDTEDCGILGCVQDMVFNKSCSIKESKGRTNFMILGAGGKEHIQGGSVLTDTIIIASLDHNTMDLSMISVPRDLWVHPPGYKPAKINTLYRTSTQYHDNGFIIPKVTIEDIFGIPIHYYAFIDFKAFTEVIDALGGVDVVIDNKFVDYKYPDGNFGYMTIGFDEGPQSMDGETSLQFARSRHGNNGESSDFARSRRQHKIILGIKDKLLSFGTLFKIDGIVDAIKDNYQSNIKPCEIYSFLLLASEISKEKTHSLVLDDGPGGLLYTPMEEVRDMSYSGQYILLPDGNNYKIIRKYVERFLNNPKVFSKGPSIAVLNGTNTIGLANKVGALLASEGFNVTKRDNTYNRMNYKKTVIYTKTPGDFYQSILLLQGLTNGNPTSVNTEPLEYGADIVLILGSDYKDLDEEDIVSTSNDLQN